MKLFLSSVGVPDERAFLSLFATKNPRLGLIAHAWDTTPSSTAKPFIDRTTTQLKSLGATPIKIDLTKDRDFSQFDGLWCLGGNTFYLNWVMHTTGFSKKLAQTGNDFVYAGESAGAVVAGTTLHGIEFLDSPKDAPETIWQGLALVEYGIIPHWGTPDDESALQKAYATMKRTTTTKTLNDEQYIITKNK